MKYYLSAFKEPRPHDGVRPATVYMSETELLAEANARGAQVVWENEPDGD
jgi:hypothetical protein